MNRVFAFIAFSFIILGCSKNQKSTPLTPSIQYAEVKYELLPTDTVEIEIDTLTSNASPKFNFIETGDKRLLFVLNRSAHQIQAYDIDEQKLKFRIKFATDGPNAIPDLSGFLFHSMDSIFLFSGNDSNNIFLIDSSGNIKSTFIVNESLNGGNDRYDISLEEYFHPTYDSKQSTLTFWVAPFINRGTKEFYQFPLIVDYDIKKRSVVKNYGYYPDSYREDNIYFLNENIYRLLADTLEIHYFDASHNLYLYNAATKEPIKTINAKSKFIPDFIEPSMKSGDERPSLQEQTNHYIQRGRYCRLLYDQKNGLFYRIVRQPQALRGPDGLLNGRIDSKFSLMVLNKKFEYCGETELKEKSFMDDFSFVSRGVLWMNINHPENESNKENYLSFILYNPAIK